MRPVRRSAKSRHVPADSRLITLQAERPVYGGAALARHEGKIYFVHGAIPGELVEARITEEKSDYAHAETVAVLESSPDRIIPPCPVYTECGGCQQQHIAYGRQVALKEAILSDTLHRIGKCDVPLSEPLIEASPWAYRHRVQCKCDGKLFGFYRTGSRDVVDVVHCPVACDGINAVLARIRPALRQQKGFFVALSELHLVSNDVVTAALCKMRAGADLSSSEYERFFSAAGVQGMIVQVGHEEIARYGDPFVSFDLVGLHYAVSAASFFQGHWVLNQRVVVAVADALRPLAGKRVLDLYAGAGNFSLPLAAEAAEVIAVEEHPDAVLSGRENCRRNGIANIRFVQSSLEQYVPDNDIDAIVLDPPRLGLSGRVVDTILKVGAERIVYVSCNPSTFARDLRKLAEAYTITSVRLIDFFPQTFHLEAMAVLERR